MRPEMGARVVFSGREQAAEPAPAEEGAESLLVPAKAVVRVEGEDGVFVVERDEVRFQPVTLGGPSGTRIEVKTGVQEGERVVVDPPARLATGDRVRIQGDA